MAGGLAAGCAGNDPWSIDPEGYDGLGEETFPLLANPCTINAGAGTMTLSVRGGETLYVSLRAADNTVIADGVTGTSAECAVPATYKIAVTEDVSNAGIEKVFLDYINGPFALGTTTAGVATPGITLALGVGSSLIVRGSSGADKIYLGSTFTTGVLQHSWINVNGDTSPDVRMDGITAVKVSTGVGADIISADGGNGTNAVALDVGISFSAFGGPDADTLTGGKGPSTLDGGDGDDKFIQTLTVGADNIVGGKGVDTVDYSLRLTAVNVTVCTVCSVDPSGCIAADTTCRGTADTAQTTCNGTAASGLTTCNGNAASALTTCNGTAASVLTTCNGNAASALTTCNTTAASDDATCTAACSGVQPCIDACDAQQVLDLAACTSTNTASLATCTSTNTTSLATCTSTNTTSLATCTSNNTTAVAACTTTHTGAFATCDATEVTCQAGATTAACAVCIADDGAVGEGDTVNDDVEIVLGSKVGDTISAQWAVCSDAAATPTVKCTLKGNEGDDTLIGSSHNDLIDGGAGNDVIQGGLGDDTLIGGAGFDTVTYADRSVTVKVSLDSTKLWVVGQNGEAGENDSIAADVENLTGGSGNDFLRGNALANIIHGGAGNDTIEGGLGNDSLYGDAGNDLLYGGAGNDMLVGGAGADTLVGGDGDDFLDASDSPAAADTVLNCDGVNDSAGTPGTAPGTADGLVKDSSDVVTAVACEL
jgi:Ca2+-binding RTX toxin-like protein